MIGRCARFAGLVIAGAALAGCGWFGGGGGDNGNATESVFDVKPGQCFVAPKTVKAELSQLTRVPCDKPHSQEAYAVVRYQPNKESSSASSGAFPGSDVLSAFAQGACAQRFASYVGIDYRDSKLFFTYLLPSARSWESDDDRNVLCFITTTGKKVSSSVKGSKQ